MNAVEFDGWKFNKRQQREALKQRLTAEARRSKVPRIAIFRARLFFCLFFGFQLNHLVSDHVRQVTGDNANCKPKPMKQKLIVACFV